MRLAKIEKIADTPNTETWKALFVVEQDGFFGFSFEEFENRVSETVCATPGCNISNPEDADLNWTMCGLNEIEHGLWRIGDRGGILVEYQIWNNTGRRS
jgi:hypothetical protein